MKKKTQEIVLRSGANSRNGAKDDSAKDLEAEANVGHTWDALPSNDGAFSLSLYLYQQCSLVIQNDTVCIVGANHKELYVHFFSHP